jgi:integrase
MRTTKLNKLTQLDVKNAGPKAILSDGGGLYLRNGLWVFRYTSPLTGKERDISLGPVSGLTLKQVRDRAAEYRNLIALKIDPQVHEAEKRETAKAEAAKNITLGEVAAIWVDAKLGDRKSVKNQKAIRSIIDRHMAPLASVPIASITSAMIAESVKPLKDRPAQRNNVVSIIHAIFDWAMASDLIPETLNPARLKKLGKLMPKRTRPVKHNRFVELDQLPTFMSRLATIGGNIARALEFVVHTGLRQNEVKGLTWNMVDLPNRCITIPGTHMKSGQAHRLFLSDRAHEIVMGMLPQRRADDGRVFPGGADDGGVGFRSLRWFLSTHFPEVGPVQVHGARSSFKTWATTRTLHRRELVELCLAHAVGGSVEMAYFDGDAPAVREAREAIYRDWSAFLTGGAPVQSAPNIVPFKTTA